ncbi:MAG: DNA methyltransferase [Candidatus Thorarchaeota archaeon]
MRNRLETQLQDRPQSLEDALDMLDEIDWDFRGVDTQYLTHRFHPYPARFIPQIPMNFIRLFTSPGDIVLDPFCGCGTTLVEALISNRRSIGNDFNPLAVLISRAKTTLVPQDELTSAYEILEHDLEHSRNTNVDDLICRLPHRRLSRVFTGAVTTRLAAIREALSTLRDEGYLGAYDLARVALSSIVWSIVEGGSGVFDSDIIHAFLSRFRMMMRVLADMTRVVGIPPETRVIQGDARRLDLDDESVDLVVTSPPYVNALDYYRVHMYNMFWLDMDFAQFRRHEIGSHSRFVPNRFRLLSQYLGDMFRSLAEMNRVLREYRMCVIVMGNSTVEGELIETHRLLSSMSTAAGFEHLKTLYRRIDTSRKYTSLEIGKINNEYILLLRKVSHAYLTAGQDCLVEEVVRRQLTSLLERMIQPSSTADMTTPAMQNACRVTKITEALSRVAQDTRLRKG